MFYLHAAVEVLASMMCDWTSSMNQWDSVFYLHVVVEVLVRIMCELD